jgi:signal transduction histidine kinase
MSDLTDDNLLNELRSRMKSTINPDDETERLRCQLERMNNKLQEAEKVQTHFLSNIRCEINNPLTAIMGHCSYLRGMQNLPIDLVHRVALTIFNEAFDLNFQIQNIIAAAEYEAGDCSPYISRVDIHFLIDDIVDTFQPRLHRKQLTLTLQNDIPENCFFQSDAQRLYLILSNIFNNAIEFSGEKNQLEVYTSITNDTLIIAVHDHGIGIEPSMLPEIFRRFHQLEQGTQRQHKGHGLGLSVAKAALDLLGGTIDVKSTPNKGSTFTLCIPQSTQAPNDQDIATDANTFIFTSSLNDIT